MYGGHNVVASGYDITQQTTFSQPRISPLDLAALLDYVREIGVPEEEVVDLQEILEEDETPSESGKLPSRAEGWLGRIATKGIEGTTTAAVGQIVRYAAQAMAQYYGVDLGS